MPKHEEYERDIRRAYEQGTLSSVATVNERAKLKAAAQATAVPHELTHRQVNIQLSAGDLSDIQIRARKEGVPYQTLITRILHNYVSGDLTERRDPHPKS